MTRCVLVEVEQLGDNVVETGQSHVFLSMVYHYFFHISSWKAAISPLHVLPVRFFHSEV